MNLRCLFFCLTLFFVPFVFSADIEPEVVSKAIERGVLYIKGKQHPNGSWEGYANEGGGNEPGGVTALCVIALRSAGLDRNDPAIRKALEYLRELAFSPTNYHNYAISLQTMAFALCETDRDLPLIRRNVKTLEAMQNTNTRNIRNIVGGWSYNSVNASSDNSNAQFSVLALYEAERAGISASHEVWERARDYWSRNQNNEGSWGYIPTGDTGSTGGTGSMTCAGISSLVVSSGMTTTGGAEVRDGRIICKTAAKDKFQAQIDSGINFMARNFSVNENPRMGQTYLFYYLYGLERVGRMTAHRFIGNHDWYREGTLSLLKRKGDLNVHWTDGAATLIPTSFAIIFLSRGRWPILISKVQYDNDKNWDPHPNDVDHLTRHVERKWKQELTWQTINLAPATSEDLLQSPVLYLRGSNSPLPMNAAERTKVAAKLRDYLDHGGFIVAEALQGGKQFDNGFRELMRLVLPEEGYDLRLLDIAHPIWHAEVEVEPDQLRPLEGINFGCRTSVIYSPPSRDGDGIANLPALSCLWEVAQIYDRGKPYKAEVQRQIDAGLGIGVNILAYATNREMKTKDQRTLEAAGAALSGTEKRHGRIFIGLLELGGNTTNAAPRAVPNLLQWADVSLGIPVDFKVDRVSLANETVFDYPVLFMHGRNAFTFSGDERKRLREFLDNGGTLFANAICSSPMFIESFQREMKAVFAETPLTRILADDELLTDQFGGFAIERLKVQSPKRTPGRQMQLTPLEQVPELDGIKIEGRWAVIFSPLDVSCALEKTATLDCKGYHPESALRLATNVLLYVMDR
ncbi:MAG: DUF4159 domain-containing protein [Planctomycetaceae bacterium]|jgi:hypothetical protein|nr:DUF4159 domain-containing protein [Planctomycetaceae bacterium]